MVWTVSALEDLSEIGLFLERDSSVYAEMIVNRLYAAVTRLGEFPMSGKQVPEFKSRSLREIVIEGYRMIYEISGQRVAVLAGIHSRRDLGSKLGG